MPNYKFTIVVLVVKHNIEGKSALPAWAPRRNSIRIFLQNQIKPINLHYNWLDLHITDIRELSRKNLGKIYKFKKLRSQYAEAKQMKNVDNVNLTFLLSQDQILLPI